MRAASAQHGTGGPEVLKFEERPEPGRGEGEVLIRVEAISVPFYETQLRSGMLPGGEPAVFGHEAVGVVVEADDEQLVEAASGAIGGPRAAEILAKLAPRGRILAYGLLSGEFPAITVADLIPRGLTLIGFGGPDAYGKDVVAARDEVMSLVADGTLTPGSRAARVSARFFWCPSSGSRPGTPAPGA